MKKCIFLLIIMLLTIPLFSHTIKENNSLERNFIYLNNNWIDFSTVNFGVSYINGNFHSGINYSRIVDFNKYDIPIFMKLDCVNNFGLSILSGYSFLFPINTGYFILDPNIKLSYNSLDMSYSSYSYFYDIAQLSLILNSSFLIEIKKVGVELGLSLFYTPITLFKQIILNKIEEAYELYDDSLITEFSFLSLGIGTFLSISF